MLVFLWQDYEWFYLTVTGMSVLVNFFFFFEKAWVIFIMRKTEIMEKMLCLLKHGS